jgi:hypothetical protein
MVGLSCGRDFGRLRMEEVVCTCGDLEDGGAIGIWERGREKDKVKCLWRLTFGRGAEEWYMGCWQVLQDDVVGTDMQC